MLVAAERVLDRIADLYRQGLYITAYEEARALGPLSRWQGPESRLLAARLANNLGGRRLGRVLHRIAYREFPTHPQVIYYHAWTLAMRRGPLAAWRFMRCHDLWEVRDLGQTVRADWAALWAQVYALLRDFERASLWLGRAEDVAPERAWVQVEKSFVLQCEDREDESIQAAQRALELRPWFRPAVQSMAHALVQGGHDEEALSLLREAATRLESGDVIEQLAALETELGLHREARDNYARLEHYFPLMRYDKKRADWLAAQRCDSAYCCEDYEAAARWAAKVDDTFYQKLAKRLSDDPRSGQRVMLPVGFVRQHRDTCAPATLAAICRHWSVPVDHLEVAEQICYDGTPAHSQRRWAEEQGFVARGFRVTWDAAVALIDRQIPFTLTTVGSGFSHLQAVIGYDTRRRTLLVRDPSQRHFTEFLADEMFVQMEASGPRGMAIVPNERADLLRDIELPEAGLYDECYAIELALQRHARDAAEVVLRRMMAAAPNHRLTIEARESLARYDADEVTGLACVQRLLARYPDNTNLLLGELAYLAGQGRRGEQMEAIAAIAARPQCDPLFWLYYAETLSDDAREYPQVERLLRRALRYRPVDGKAVSLLAHLRWQQGERDEAFELYRLAACIDDKDETRNKGYFAAAQHLRRTDEAVRMLCDRLVRFGSLSTWPVRTLAWAYERLERTQESLDVLQGAVQQHPEDGALMLQAADACARFGQADKAEELLTRAKPHAHRTQWWRTAARLSSYQGDHERSLQLWRQVREAEPLAEDANGNIAMLLADLEGHAAAMAHLRAAVTRFPHNHAFRVTLIQWLRDDDPEAAETELRDFLQLHPVDPWAHRELAICLLTQRRWDDAEDVVSMARALEPSSPVVGYIEARLHAARGEHDRAKQACREAIRISVDYDPAIHCLIGVCDTKAERQEALAFVRSELANQVVSGDGLMAFREYATPTLDADELLDVLEEGVRQRPDLWQCWSAMIQQRLDMQQVDVAVHVARQAADRFPLLPRAWVDLAAACGAKHNVDGQTQALLRALAITPGWSEPARALAEVYWEQGEGTRARRVLERAIAHEPREARNYGALAQLLWQQGDQEEALTQIIRAIQIAPRYPWAWEVLRGWCAEAGQPERALEPARRLTQLRPKEPHSWLTLAEGLDALQQPAACLEALERALDCDPQSVTAHGMKVDVLAAEGRLDEALAACRPPGLGPQPPLALQAREAVVHSQRGEVAVAIATMRRVVQDDLDYFWAWQKLADWYEWQGDAHAALEAAEHMTRIAPQYATAWGYLGCAQDQLGESGLAKEHFRRAVELDPRYSYGVYRLIDLQLKAGEVDAADDTLAAGGQWLGEAYRQAQQVRVTTARNSKEEALEQLTCLCHLEMESREPLAIAAHAMFDHGWQHDVLQLLSSRLDKPGVSVQTGPVFVELSVRNMDWRSCVQRLQEVADRPELWNLSAIRLLELADCEPKSVSVGWTRKFLKRHRRRLAGNLSTWAAAGEAWSCIGESQKAVKWVGDWPTRDGVTAAMLLPLVANLWLLGRQEEAVLVSRHAAQLAADGSTCQHVLWVATDCALHGDFEAARGWLARANATQLGGFYQRLHALLAALVVDWQTRDYATARRSLRDGYQPVGDADALLASLYHRCQLRLARKHHRWLAAGWHALRG